MNQVTLIGNVGRDPEIRYTQSGDPVANLTLATSERWKNKNGEKQEQTEWHRITFFGGVAQVVRDYVQKGSRIAVIGKVHYSKWTDKDGNDKYSTEIQVGRGGQLELLTSKRERNETAGSASGSGAEVPFEATDDDVPF